MVLEHGVVCSDSFFGATWAWFCMANVPPIRTHHLRRCGLEAELEQLKIGIAPRAALRRGSVDETHTRLTGPGIERALARVAEAS